MRIPRQAAGLTLSRVGLRGNGATVHQSALVVGGGHVGRSLAAALRDDYRVTFASRRPEVVERAERDGLDTHLLDGVDPRSLARAGADDAAMAVVATDDDGANLLAAQLLCTRFDVDDVVVRVNDAGKRDSFDGLAATTVCVPDLLAAEVTDRLEAAADELSED